MSRHSGVIASSFSRRQTIANTAIGAFISIIFSGYSFAEGIYQFGTDLNQPLASTTNIFIHVPNDGDIIRTHLCRKIEGGADDPNEPVSVKIYTVKTGSDGVIEKDIEVASLSSPMANIDCAHDFTTSLPKTPATGSLMEFAAADSGIYAIELAKTSNIHYGRWDFSIVSNLTPNADVDPTIDAGNVFSYRWNINRVGTGGKATATNADLYSLVPGGFANTNYVWQIDLNEFAGSDFQLATNGIGVTGEPGVSAPVIGNSMAPLFPVYLSYPVGANPSSAPLNSPALTDTLSFEDDAGLDHIISPDDDANEETGNFEFTSDVDGTYELTIDLNNDGVFNEGDHTLLGSVEAGSLNTINWDATDAAGLTVVNGEYEVQLMLRVGEMHVVVKDAETSGGGTNDDGSVEEGGTGADDGLTILQATNVSTLVGTQVYWDDAINFGADSNTPNGALSSTATSGVHRHTWGDFTGNGIGSDNYIDTYTYGNFSTATVTLIVAADNTPPTLSDFTLNINENSASGASVGTVTGADVDGDFLIYAITAGNDSNLFSIDADSGEITTNGSLNHEDVDQHSLTVQVSDYVNTDSATVTIDINDLNDAPVINGTPSTTATQGQAYLFTPIALDEDGDILTFSIVNQPSWASFNSTDGVLSGTPANADVGSYADVTISVASNGGLSDSLDPFTLVVGNTNDAPVANDDSVAINEDTAITIDVLDNDTDVDVGDVLTIASVSSVVNGTALIFDNQIIFTPDANFNGSGSFVYTTSDGSFTDSANVTVAVNSVNDAPIISGTPSNTVEQNAAYLFTPSASDVDGELVTFSIVGRPAWATFDSASGTLSGMPGNDDIGVYNGIVITASSQGPLTDDLDPFSITVNNLNDAPVANDDISTTDEDIEVIIDVLANDSDIDVSDNLTINSLTSVVNGTAVILNNQITFTPTANVNGTGTLTYTVTDGLVTDSANVTVTINPINDVPVIDGTPGILIDQDVPYSFIPSASDSDGDALTFSIVGQPSWASFSSVTGRLNGTPTNADIGEYLNIIISVNDASDSASLAAFTITVADLNDAPVAVNDSVSTDEDVPIIIDVMTNDSDADVGDSIAISQVTDATNGSAIIESGQVVFTPDANFNGTASFSYDITDGIESDSANVIVTVNSINDQPVISGTPATSILQDSSYSFVPIASDADGDILTFAISNQPSWAAFSTASGALTGTPANSDVGDYANIEISVSSAGGLSDTLPIFTLSVTNTNDAPLAVDDSATTDEDNAITIDVLANDSDQDIGDTLVITETNNAVGGTASIITNQVIYSPNAEFSGTGSFNYIISDGSVTDSATVTITVNNINDAPIISGSPANSVEQDSAYLFIPVASDDDGDVLTFSIANQPSWSSFSSTTGQLSGTPANEDVANYSNIIITVTSAGSLNDSLAPFNINVVDINDAPVANNDTATVDEDSHVTIDVLANDTDLDLNDTLTLSSIINVTNGTAVLVGSEVLYTPSANFNGTGSFDYTVTDGDVTDLANVQITVNSIDDAPEISGNPSTSIAQDSAYGFTPNASDSDGDALTFSIVNQPSWSTFNAATGRLSGTPRSTDVGVYGNITLTVTAGGESDSLTAFSITVSNVNDAPIAVDDSISIDEDSGISIDVLANDTDADVNDELILLNINSVSSGSAVIENNRLSYTPVSDFNGVATVTYTVTDSVLTDSGTVTITVNSINDAPVIGGTPATSVLENELYSFTPAASDSDGDSLTFAIVNQPAWTSFSTSTGSLTGTPDHSDAGIYGNIQISVSSDGGLSDSLPAFTIEVDDVNVAPVLVDDAVTTDEDIAISIDVLSNDTDVDEADTLIVTAVTSVINGSAEIINNQILFTPTSDFNGISSFDYSVTDGAETDSASATITVNAIDDAPIISGTPSTQVAQDVAYSFTPAASDVEGDVLTFSINNKPSWASFSTTTGALTGTPDNDDVGSYPNIQITVTSGVGLSDSLTLFAITVVNINDEPVAVDDLVSTDEDTPVLINILINDFDLDDDKLTVDSQSALNGTLLLNNDQTLLYTPNTNFNGADTINYTVSDGNGGTDSGEVAVTVNSINDKPIALDDASTILEGTTETVFVLANDSDQDNDTLTIVSADAANGDVIINANNSLTYTPKSTFVGVENIVYTLQDGQGGEAAATWIVSVNPVAIDISGTPATALLEGEEYSFTPSVQASDNVTYIFSITNQPAWTEFDTLTGSLSGIPSREDVMIFADIEVCVDDTFATDCLSLFDISVTGDLDQDGIGDDVDEDIDGDGMSNEFETANGFDPADASDADGDADGDGVSNLDEFLAGSDPNTDDNPPSLTQPADIIVDASGLLNEVLIGNATATDFVNGISSDCCEIFNDAPVRFSTGTTEVTWTATDDAGNVSTELQTIRVNPIVSFAGNVTVAEGEQGSVTLLLNGVAPTYPFEVAYSITGGTAMEGDDYTWSVSTVVFTEGTRTDIYFDVAEDTLDEGVESITLELDDNENRGAQFSAEVSISEDNIAPFASLDIQQGGNRVNQVQPDLGIVTVEVEIVDANRSDSHTFDWSASDNRLSNTASNENTFIFDPSNLSLDTYRLALTITDSGTPAETAFAINDLNVVDTAVDESTGLPCSIAPHNADMLDQFLAETQMGLCIHRSHFSKLSEGEGILLSANDFSSQSNLSNDEHTTVGGRFDFNLQSSFAFSGYEGTVVIPLAAVIPVNNLLRILVEGSWRDFAVNESNRVFSAPSDLGYCPPPFDASYVTGLVAGNACIQLSITDGGVNDADSTVNGVIEFTGGVHEEVIPPPPTSTPTSSGGSGGGSLPFGIFILLWLLKRLRAHRYQ